MTATHTRRRTLPRVALAAALSVAAGCGSGESSNPTAAAGSGPSTESTAATTAASTTAPATSGLWSSTIAADLAAVQPAFKRSGEVVGAMEGFFGSPVALPLPDDGALSTAVVRAERIGDTWAITWQFAVVTEVSNIDLEAAIVEGFTDDRFEVGERVESMVESDVIVTLDYPATAAAAADGWAPLAITVGPSPFYGSAHDLNEVAMTAARTVPIDDMADDPGLSWFVQGWLPEMPVADGLRLTMLSAELEPGAIAANVQLDAEYEPVDGGPTFEELIEFYSPAFEEGAVRFGPSIVQKDLSMVEGWNVGMQPTFAGYQLGIMVTRVPAEPAEPPVVSFRVRLRTE